MTTRVTLNLWLHRDERDAWLVSRSGVGAGRFVPKSEVEIEDGHPLPLMGPVGPLRISMPRWLADKEGLVDRPDEGQRTLF